MIRSAIRLALSAALLWAALLVPSLAQTSPNWTQGKVPTQAEWNNIFASKQDYLGSPPLLTSGGSMLGRFLTAPSNLTRAGFNVQSGVAPTTPVNGDIWYAGTQLVAQINGTSVPLGASAGSVTSVAMTVPGSFLSVSGSPITISGTLAVSLLTQTANTVFAGPTTGGAVAPTFRALVNADFPTGFVVAGLGLTGGSLAGGGTIAIDKATGANYFAGASNKFISTDTIYNAETTTTFGSTTTFDFGTFINTKVTLTGNITTQTLSGVMEGKAGSIRFIQDGTGSRTTVWNSIFKWSSGSAPTLTTTAGASDVLIYNCLTATFCQASLNKDVR
jgi:hypothetical protein